MYDFHCSMVHKPIASKVAMNILDTQATVDKAWDKLTNLPAWDFKQIKFKSEVVQLAKKDGRVHLGFLMDFRHLKHFGLAKNLRKYKEGVVKDDNGY